MAEVIIGVGAEDSASFYEWCREEAKKINSDGCTLVDEWNQNCCWEHDLGCSLKKDPRVAFKEGWELAPPISRREADIRYWKCNRQASPSLWGKLRADIRYIGVRIGSLWPF